MIINIDLNEKDYQLLFKIKKKEREIIINKIFKTGYECYFPTKNLDANIKNNKLENKIDLLESTLEKLIGMSCSSMRKGELAENILEKIITEKYGDIKYTDMSQVNHSGDAWLNFDSFNKAEIIILVLTPYLHCFHRVIHKKCG